MKPTPARSDRDPPPIDDVPTTVPVEGPPRERGEHDAHDHPLETVRRPPAHDAADGSRPLSVRTRLIAAFGVLAALVLLVAVIAIAGLSKGHADYARQVHQTAARIALANDLLDATHARAIAARNLVLVETAADREAEHAEVTRAHEKVQRTITRLNEALAAMPDVGGRERQLFDEVERIESRYGPVALDIVARALAGQRAEAIQRMNADCRPLLAQLVRAADAYIASGQRAAADDVKEAEAAYVLRRNLLLGACALAIVLAIALAAGLTRGLTRALGAEPADLSAAAQRVAEGDLRAVTHEGHLADGSVMASLRHMRAGLVAIVAQVRAASDSVATGSAQIAIGSTDLSRRTEEQAANLEQAAAAMEQLSATVRRNADSAQQASRLAAAASAVAQTGGRVVAQVVSTMDEIAESSRRIAHIVGVIDGIAFQTNILALNAAVEAARGAEQGRGFAVVAGEVRALAQRSAEAAKQIKSMIDASVARVDSGARLVADAGTTMDSVVSQVLQVAGLIEQISLATAEQTRGIHEVTGAVSQLDRATQQNAALVEESAAAADSLKQQAARLAAAVSVFRL